MPRPATHTAKNPVLMRLIATAGAVAAAACSSSHSTAPQTGTLTITVTAPAVVTPQVTVSGPAGYTKMLSATTTLSALAAGSYAVSAASVTSADSTVGTFNSATVTGSPATVAAGAAATATVTYTRRPGSGGLWVGTDGMGDVTLEYGAGQLAATSADSPATVLGIGAQNSAVAIDSAGNLWVAGLSDSVIREFAVGQLAASGSPTPHVTLSAANGSLAFPGAMTFDAQGNLWVANEDDSSIVEFAAAQLTTSGSPTPAVVIGATAGSLDVPSGVAFNAAGSLWVTNIGTNTVVEFTPAQLAESGTPTPAVTLSANGQSLATPRAPAFDPHGNLWVTNVDANTISEFTPAQRSASGSPAATVMLTASANSIAGPDGLAFDASGDLWVANGDFDTIVEFRPSQLVASGSPTPVVIVSGDALAGPWGLAFDPHASNLPLKP